MIWTGIIFTTVAYAAFFTAWIVATVPHAGEKGWTSRELALRMGQQTPKIILGLGVLGTATDFYIIAIPLTAISTLHMSFARKIGVLALFATGFLYEFFRDSAVSCCSLVLIPVFNLHRACGLSAAVLAARVDNYLKSIVYNTPDPSWLSAPSYALA